MFVHRTLALVLLAGCATSRNAAERGQCSSAEDCFVLGTLYEAGDGVPKSKVRAAAKYRVACTRGDAHGCQALAEAYAEGRGVEQNLERAAHLHERACKGQLGAACKSLGDDYAGGKGVERDGAMALMLFQVACEMGDGAGCYGAGAVYDLALVPGFADRRWAARFYQKGCVLGDRSSCGSLGALYETGRGVERDIVRSTELYFTACELGDGRVCASLAEKFHQLDDSVVVAHLHKLACGWGVADSCRSLAKMYEAGEGVTRDRARALQLFQTACDRGAPLGCRDACALGSDRACECQHQYCLAPREGGID